MLVKIVEDHLWGNLNLKRKVTKTATKLQEDFVYLNAEYLRKITKCVDEYDFQHKLIINFDHTTSMSIK